MEQLSSSNSSMTTQSYSVNVVSSVVLGICFVLGVPGNIAVMVRLTGWLKGDSFTPKLMLSLAVSDLLTLLPVPTWIWYFTHDWIFGLFLCKFLFYMAYLNLYCSNLCVVFMSVQRYVQVLHPQKWAKITDREKKILVSGMWILSGVLASYALVQCTVKVGRDGQLKCQSDYRNDTEKVATLVWETLIFFLLFFLLAYFYFCLYKGVTQSAFFHSHTMTKLVTRIVVTFFLCRLPYNIEKMVFIAALSLKNYSVLKSAEAALKITGSLVLVNSCVNPFLYAFSARALQQPPAGAENVS